MTTVLVVGPPLSGADGVAAALRTALPDHAVMTDDARVVPDVVVAVVSAVAPLTRTDWEQLERAATRTEVVVGVVSKIDAHRGWRDVLDADRRRVERWSPRRAAMPWVGVAAAPDLGEARIDALVDLLTHPPARGVGVADRRPARDALAVKSVLARTRIDLLRLVRDRSAALRGELRDRAAALPSGGAARFEADVRDRAVEFLADVDAEVDHAIAAAAAELGLGAPAAGRPARIAVPAPMRPTSRRLEGRLMAVLGMGVALGIAVAVSRLLAGLLPGSPHLGPAAGFVVGLAMVVWVVRTRRLLHDRALLDGWVTEVAAALRWHAESVVAERVLAAEVEWMRRR